jgi:hypothetical protein
MQRPGADKENMELSDFLCDFCRTAWDGTFALVEGHQGSLICQDCMTIAYDTLVTRKESTAPAGAKCTMCLEVRDDAMWQSPAYEDAVICKRCCKQGAGRLHKDPDIEWSKPAE